MLKRTIWFIILALLFLLIIEPNFNGLKIPQPKSPPVSQSLITNEDALKKQALTERLIVLEGSQDPQKKELLDPLLDILKLRLQEAGYEVVMSDSAAEKADLKLSLDMSSSQSDWRGFSIFTTPDDLLIDLSEEIALLLQQIHFSTYLGVDSDHYENFSQLSGSDIPAILIQIGYITNEQDVAKIEDSEVQDAIGKAISSAVLEILS